MQLSVIVITRNEAHNIRGCLESVAFADEFVVVDSGSTDATCEIAAACGARVSRTTDWPGFGAQKNRALALARGTWVLSLDADERVSPTLAQSLRAALAHDAAEAAQDAAAGRVYRPGIAGYEMDRLSRFCGQWMRHGDWNPDRVLRLFRRGAGRFSDDRVHEQLRLEGQRARLEGALLHETMPTLEDALDKMNRYSSGRALDRVAAGRSGGLGAALSHGAWAFLRSYVVKRGFLDGALGFILAVYIAEGTYYRYLKMRWLAPAK
jgi:glycosyltransferase involved in cell wall biosynthesis